MATIEFWFDFASTYSYPAAARIERLACEKGISVIWRSFLLGPIFQQQGWNDSPFNIYPTQGCYMWRDLERICADLGIPLRQPSVFPRNSVLAARVACCFASEPWLPEFVRHVFSANFADDQDISNRAVIEGCLDRVGVPGAEKIEQALMPASKNLLRAQTEHAAAISVFGAPTFIVDHEIFWGNDRLEQAMAWCKSPGLNPPA
ncbi:MAG: 2-hydroxychromene-2-carboxylate isomerase [Candidatus Competibacteraceae bacterium]|uniref:2-hydroxychromene-2-carboxylate isomerase n=1 Tax=Candidatus Contendobacter odensis Run_B_J11 TaxID=1400861 RepID=A0A7U7GFI6_9GAMM|nr:2-hydroxychromene-2-carboxylate isomerase [Candidatus Contendobacter odensis]MBK8537224.1 2-hydroxychromene-2-carboxylate isomerase [Candidatus Competibacteraceae bacterium]MBK8754312.1 2-hydroxychromene-2-carboxylate isomerase [Candidatus Competibacteraceae bacterium]CDH47203.1 DSBA oxidoreductase [Candidatus Contendobacter odensis Run_B_J11]